MSPVFPAGILRRYRIINILNENINKPLILICAPAGYGKTTTVMDFLNTSGKNYFCITITNNLYSDRFGLLNDLIAVLKKYDKRFGSGLVNIVNAINSNPNIKLTHYESSQSIAKTFETEIRKYIKNDVIVFIDDLHCLN